MLGRQDLEKMRRRVLMPLGVILDLDFDVEHKADITGEREEAFRLVSCGFDLLVGITAPDPFPSLRRRTRGRGSRLVRRDIVFGAANASIFLAAALPELIARTGENLEPGLDTGGPKPEHEAFLGLAATLRGFFLVKRGQGTVLPHETLVGRCLAEFRVLEKGEPNPHVVKGEEPASKYNAMLMDGEDPRSDPALVEEQRRYARDYFINRATLRAIMLSLDMPRLGTGWDEIEQDILELAKADRGSSKVMAQQERSLAAWREGAGAYLEHARAAAALRAASGLA